MVIWNSFRPISSYTNIKSMKFATYRSYLSPTNQQSHRTERHLVFFSYAWCVKYLDVCVSGDIKILINPPRIFDIAHKLSQSLTTSCGLKITNTFVSNWCVEIFSIYLNVLPRIFSWKFRNFPSTSIVIYDQLFPINLMSSVILFNK